MCNPREVEARGKGSKAEKEGEQVHGVFWLTELFFFFLICPHLPNSHCWYHNGGMHSAGLPHFLIVLPGPGRLVASHEGLSLSVTQCVGALW